MERRARVVELPVAKAFSGTGGPSKGNVPIGYKKYPTLEIAYHPKWGGLVARNFPTQIVFRLDIMDWAKENKGLIEIEGKGGVGTKVTFQFLNGHATYEIQGRVHTIDPQNPYLLLLGRKTLKRIAVPTSKKENENG